MFIDKNNFKKGKYWTESELETFKISKIAMKYFTVA